jgi:hypothetical protein
MVKKLFQVTVPLEVKRTVLTEITADTLTTACTNSFVQTVKMTEFCATAVLQKGRADFRRRVNDANYKYRKFVTKLPKR